MTAMQRPTQWIRPMLAVMTAGVVTLSAFAPLGTTAYAAPGLIAQNAPQARQDKKDEGPPMLTDEDIDLIRVYEFKFRDEDGKPPTIKIPKKTLNEMIKKYRDNDAVPRGKKEQAAFLRADGVKQLQLMFELRAREFYKDVRISTPIESLREWNKLHKSYVMGYFGKHFGSGNIAGLKLLPRSRDEKRVAITNFYLLTQANIDGKPLIDRHNPSESLLLQWGLPREEAKFAAPDDLERWQPYYKDTEDERFIEAVNWIESLVAVNQGSDYDIKFSLEPKEDEDSAE